MRTLHTHLLRTTANVIVPQDQVRQDLGHLCGDLRGHIDFRYVHSECAQCRAARYFSVMLVGLGDRVLAFVLEIRTVMKIGKLVRRTESAWIIDQISHPRGHMAG